MSRVRWQQLTVESPSEALNAALAEGLIDLGGSAVHEDGLTLSTCVRDAAGADAADPERAADSLAERAAELLAERAGVPVHVRWSWLADDDWLARWRAGLGPRRVGDRLIVAPTWTLSQVAPAPRDIVIAIDPQMAFGTGEHASTRGVLRLMERAVRPGAFVLDVGTGSGILAIAALKLGASAVHAVESDPDALENARENLARNGADGVRLEHAIVDEAWLAPRSSRRYDLIVANVLRAVLEPLLPAFARALRPGGALVLGGILDTEATPMTAAAAAAGLRLVAEDTEDGWRSAVFAGHGANGMDGG